MRFIGEPLDLLELLELLYWGPGAYVWSYWSCWSYCIGALEPMYGALELLELLYWSPGADVWTYWSQITVSRLGIELMYETGIRSLERRKLVLKASRQHQSQDPGARHHRLCLGEKPYLENAMIDLLQGWCMRPASILGPR